MGRRITSYRRPKNLPKPNSLQLGSKISENENTITNKIRELYETIDKTSPDDDIRDVKRQKSDDNVPPISSSPTSEENLSLLSGIALPPASKESRPGYIFVFENASLVLAKINKTYQIINPDEHAGFMRKHNLDRRDYRPDIIFEVLKRLLGGPLSMTGGIQAVYVKTIEGNLIRIEPTLAVPPTLKLFCAMMSQLLQNLSIKGSGRNKNKKLLQMIKNPVTTHLPAGSHIIGLSSTSSKGVDLGEYFDTIGNDRTLVFVIGAMAHGKIENKYADDFIAVSELPLCARACVSLICDELKIQRTIM